MNSRIYQMLVAASLALGALGAAADAPATTQTVNEDNLILREQAEGMPAREFGIPMRVGHAPTEVGPTSVPGVFERRDHTRVDSGQIVSSDGRLEGQRDDPTADSETDRSVGRFSSPTIDTMTFEDETENYQPYLPIGLMQFPDVYTLSDGSSWDSGAGSFGYGRVVIDNVEVVGGSVRYTLTSFDDGLFLNFTDYNSGDHSAVGRLDLEADILIDAEIGATTAAVRVPLLIVENAPANYNDDRFYYFSSIVDSVVVGTFNIEILDGTWQQDTFDSAFTYRVTDGQIDFANPLSAPEQTGLSVLGATQLPPNAEIALSAVAEYDNGALRDVSADATWSVSTDLITISDTGVVTTGSAPAEDVPVTVTAQYEGFSETLDMLLIGASTLALPEDTWATFQGNVQHSGYVGGATDPADFNVRWEVSAASSSLHQAAIAEGKVFVTVPSRFNDRTHVVALDLVDGEQLWTRSLGPVNSVNPPAYAYGNVYVQTGKATSNSYPPMVRALSAETGQTIFESVFSAQWESYEAPTIADGRVYVNGGTYGGMYRMNAFSGQQDWFASLPQYDEWTPTLDTDRAYAYVGGSFIAVDRETGERAYTLQDPNFDWNGYSVEGAVALEGQRAVMMHNRRLVAVDIGTPPSIMWDRLDNFVGQPAIAEGVIYILQASALKAISVETGADLWTWNAPAGETLSGPVTLTDTHVFLSSDSKTYAIEILARDDVWSYPAAGLLSVGQDHLLIAQQDGMLTAVAMPVILDSPVASIDIVGPDSVQENTSANYRAMVTYEDGRIRDRTVPASWIMKDSLVASIDDNGRLSVVQLIVPQETIGISVSYTEGEITVTDEAFINLFTPLSNGNFALRAIEGANVIKRSVLEQLLEAKRLELSARYTLHSSSDADEMQALTELITALQSGQAGIESIDTSAEALQRAIEALQ